MNELTSTATTGIETDHKNETAANPVTELATEAARETETQATLQQLNQDLSQSGRIKPLAAPASTVPTHRRKKFEVNHRVNVTTREPGQIISEVKMDMYGSSFIVPDAASGFVQYLQPDDE